MTDIVKQIKVRFGRLGRYRFFILVVIFLDV